MKSCHFFQQTLCALSLLMAVPVFAQEVSVKNAWIRGTVQGQNATGAFMELTGKSNTRLVGAASPAAKSVEVHNMKVDNGVMKMFPVDGVDLPAGKPVKLAPGGFHVMLMDLQKPLKAGDKVPLKLTFETANKKRETLDLNVEVRDLKGQPAQHQH
ncbi:MAG: copper chaperone PCu(A)C [Burkholderiales bacterium]|jgi:copper(I)-binding protein